MATCTFVFAARQMGFVDAGQVPELCRLAQDYLRNSEGCKESIYQYVANGEYPNALYAKLIDEFERCILSYFAFHWNRASFIISQVHNSLIKTPIHLLKKEFYTSGNILTIKLRHAFVYLT